MTLQHIRYLLTIVETGSITEAAKRLFISQPSLSNSVKEIEKEVGFPIFIRNHSGIAVTSKGQEFLGYVRAVSQQMDLLEAKYFYNKPTKVRFCVSTQHYTFTANAFVEIVSQFSEEKYEFILNETQTYQVIQDVKNRFSDLGIIYMSDNNRDVLRKVLRENDVVFHPLCTASMHIFISRQNPLASQDIVTFDDLKPYPKLSFIQGNYESEYFSEEPFSMVPADKIVRVSDRASIVNFMLGLNGYTIASGIYPPTLQERDVISIPLATDEKMEIGYILKKDEPISELGARYLNALKKYYDKSI